MSAEPVARLETFDYPSPEVVECPYPFYRALRDEAPVHRLPDGTMLISRWEDVAAVVRDADAFSSRIGPRNDQILGGPRVGGDDSGPWPLPFTDGAVHRAQRSFAASLVLRSRLRWFEPRIARLTDELIDGFIATGTAEFRAAFAAPLPRRVMMEAFGFPRSDEPDLIRWTSGHGPVGSRLASAAEQAAEQERRLALAQYMRRQIRERRREPADDYLTEIVSAQEQRDGAPDEPYLLAEVANLFAAGNHTTAHMIASTMLLLLERPRLLARVRADRGLLGALLEEGMRLEAPVQWLQRIATRDVVIRGVTIPAGTVVLVVWAAANRDEREFEDPEQLDLERPALATRQLAFGYGRHRCIGAPLARLEGRIAFERLLDRLANLRLTAALEELAHIPNMNQRAPASVPIAFDAA